MGLLITLIILFSLCGCSIRNKNDQSNISIDISPDKKLIVFNAFGNNGLDLYLLDLTTKKSRLISSLEGDELTPMFSHDGRKIIFSLTPVNRTYSEIYEFDIVNSRLKLITSDSKNLLVFDSRPIYGKNDDEIYFFRAARRRRYSFGGYVWDHWDLYKSKNQQVSRISHNLFYQLYTPNYNKISDEIFFSAFNTDNKTTDVYKIKNNGDLSLYKKNCYYYTSSKMSDKSVYIRDNDGDYDFEVYSDLKNSNDIKLTELKSYTMELSISNDGNDVYFLSSINRDKRYDLYRVKYYSKHVEKIVGSNFFDNPLIGDEHM